MADSLKRESSQATHAQGMPELKQAGISEQAVLRLRLLAEAARTVCLIEAAHKRCEAAAQAIEAARRILALRRSLKTRPASWVNTTIH